ncbi:MAG: glycosyltransferase, partial [Nitrospira sp.]|nr:glycosyltransferase [Nitrospira sp.]
DVPGELRDWLVSNGHEVGVHDLHHDGKLYSSYNRFRNNARKINQYLKAWGAVGFRSGFMLRRLDWMHQLDVAYDASTFDTDPFEPLPDGVCTIFPYWVPHTPHPDSAPTPRERGGFVELPYTLPQDSTLFLYLGQRDISTWLKKLDWIVERGGMALVNVHPDYLDFNGGDPRHDRFPSALYTQFLEEVHSRYGGSYWHVLPRDLVSWWLESVHGSTKPTTTDGTSEAVRLEDTKSKPLAGLRAAAVLYSYYPADPRPRRAAEAMADAGAQVDMICLRENAATPTEEVINGVHVTRVPLQRRRAGKLTYVWQYLAFTVLSFLTLTRRSLRRRYDVVHTHNMPDFLVFASLVPRLQGAKILLDLHDPMPELCMSIFGLKQESLMVKLLRWIERLSLRFAHLGITPNLAFKKLFVSRSCPDDKMLIVMNSPQEHLFPLHAVTEAPAPPKTPNAQEPYIIMFHGSLVHRHGLDIAVEALEIVRKTLPAAELRVFGAPTPYLEEVLELARSKNMA